MDDRPTARPMLPPTERPRRWRVWWLSSGTEAGSGMCMSRVLRQTYNTARGVSCEDLGYDVAIYHSPSSFKGVLLSPFPIAWSMQGERTPCGGCDKGRCVSLLGVKSCCQETKLTSLKQEQAARNLRSYKAHLGQIRRFPSTTARLPVLWLVAWALRLL